MKIIDLKVKAKCEMPNCTHIADVKIEKSGFFKSVGLRLCKDCMNELYAELATRIVPKSPNNMLNKRVKTKEVKNYE